MTGAFERAKDAILRESEGNGGLSSRNLFDVIVAANADSASRDQAMQQTLRAHGAMIEQHEQANVNREDRFIRAETETLAIAAEEMRQCQETHVKIYHAPRRRSDPPDETWTAPPEDEQLGDMRRFWRALKWAAIAAGAATIVALANVIVRLIFGT